MKLNKNGFKMPTQHTLHSPTVVSHQALTSVAMMVRTLCTLTSLFKSTIEDKYTEKLCKGGATFLTTTHSSQTPKMTFLAALTALI